MLTQTLAIFTDAYRELNSRKLFWVVLAISLAIVIGLSLPSNNEKGVAIFGFTLNIPFLSTNVVSPAGFYKFLFANTGVDLWLTWGAMVLALISTAGMIPDMIASGAVEMTLSKPLSRVRLFLTKYTAGLMFVALQTLVFSLGAFMVIGIRGGQWSLGVFIAVPLVVLFFSYLFSVCALIGLITRSSIAALLLTLLFWLLLFGLNTTEHVLLQNKLSAERQVTRSSAQIENLDKAISMIQLQLDKARGQATPSPSDKPGDVEQQATPSTTPDRSAQAETSTKETASADAASSNPRRPNRPWSMSTFSKNVKSAIEAATPTQDVSQLQARLRTLDDLKRQALADKTDAEKSVKSLSPWHSGIFAGKTILPKTSETSGLLSRYVIDKKDREGLLAEIEERMDEGGRNSDLNRVLEARSVWWVVGTSLLFQFVTLTGACWIFARRDF